MKLRLLVALAMVSSGCKFGTAAAAGSSLASVSATVPSKSTLTVPDKDKLTDFNLTIEPAAGSAATCTAKLVVNDAYDNFNTNAALKAARVSKACKYRLTIAVGSADKASKIIAPSDVYYAGSSDLSLAKPSDETMKADLTLSSVHAGGSGTISVTGADHGGGDTKVDIKVTFGSGTSGNSSSASAGSGDDSSSSVVAAVGALSGAWTRSDCLPRSGSFAKARLDFVSATELKVTWDLFSDTGCSKFTWSQFIASTYTLAQTATDSVLHQTYQDASGSVITADFILRLAGNRLMVTAVNAAGAVGSAETFVKANN